MRLPALVLLTCSLALTGCSVITTTATPGTVSGSAISGNVHGGQQPIVGAHVYLMAANTTGYGGPGIAPSTLNASLSLLNPLITLQSDSVGAYVTTAADGSFTITGDYTCMAGQQVYLYALGGNPGAGANASSGLLATLGACPGLTFSPTQFVWINEVTTIATAYAFAGFASDATHVSSSGTTLAQTGIANAFANAANLVNPTTGAALATTPAGNGTVLTSRLNTLANILASCINSTGAVTAPSGQTSASNCYALFYNAQSAGSSGTIPSDTATAAINIAHNPVSNVSNLFSIPPPTIAFAPALATQPNDLSVWLIYTGVQNANGLAIDNLGNVWVANTGSNNVVKLSPTGAILSGANGFTGGGLNAPLDIAIDSTGNIWTANYGNNSVTELNSSGAPLSGTGYTGGGLAQPIRIAIDGAGAAWVTNYAFTSGASYAYGSITKFSSSGVALAQSDGPDPVGTAAAYSDTAIDGAGDAWSTKSLYQSSSSSSGELIQQLSPTAAFLNAYQPSGPPYSAPRAIAIDGNGNVWAASGPANVVGSVTEISHTGTILTQGSFVESAGFDSPVKIAIDGGGNAWVATYNNLINEISPLGSILTGSLGITLPTSPQNGGPAYGGAFAIDGSGNLWTATSALAGVVRQVLGAATPVITPIAAGLPLIPTTNGSSNLGTRP